MTMTAGPESLSVPLIQELVVPRLIFPNPPLVDTEGRPYAQIDQFGNRYHPYGMGWMAVNVLYERRNNEGVTLGEDAIVGPFCKLFGRVAVGARAMVMPRSTLSNATIGEDGYVPTRARIGNLTPQLSNEVLERRRRIASEPWGFNEDEVGFGVWDRYEI